MAGRLVRLLAAFALVIAPVMQLCPAQAQAMPAAGCEHPASDDGDQSMAAAKCAIGCAVVVPSGLTLDPTHKWSANSFAPPVNSGRGYLGEVATPPPR
jgi:hypothetical protein